jgi:hypothetical protein
MSFFGITVQPDEHIAEVGGLEHGWIMTFPSY